MNRYEKTFQALSLRNEGAFIPFAVAGDPDIATSERIFKTYIDSGADILEIGYPFSDPVADGPVNQRAGMRAISAGLNHSRFFKLIKTLRAYTDIPFGLLLYANTVLHLGYSTFCRKAGDAGMDSLLVADMPPEESGELSRAIRASGMGTVHIVSELTPPARMKLIGAHVDSFVYVVSRLGPTGARTDLSSSVSKTLSTLRKHTAKPLCVGFGISRPEHVRGVIKAGADGAIVGSALVKTLESSIGDTQTMLKKIGRQVKAYKAATRPE